MLKGLYDTRATKVQADKSLGFALEQHSELGKSTVQKLNTLANPRWLHKLLLHFASRVVQTVFLSCRQPNFVTNISGEQAFRCLENLALR